MYKLDGAYEQHVLCYSHELHVAVSYMHTTGSHEKKTNSRSKEMGATKGTRAKRIGNQRNGDLSHRNEGNQLVCQALMR